MLKFVNGYFVTSSSVTDIRYVIDFYREKHHDFKVDFSNDFIPVCVGPSNIYIDIGADLTDLARICDQINVAATLCPIGYAITPEVRKEMRRAIDECYRIIIMSNSAARKMMTKHITYTKLCDIMNDFDYMSAITILTKK